MDTSGAIVISICFTLLVWAALMDFLKTTGREASALANLLIIAINLIMWYYFSKHMLGVK